MKVSCLMPACYGDLSKVAVQCFLDQTYTDRELIILDNNKSGDTIEHLVPKDDARFVYVRTDPNPIGVLRNEGIALASGDIVCNWDCDDWYSADRIATQVELLNTSGKAMTGYHNILYYQMAPDASGGTYKYYFDIGGRFSKRPEPCYATGTSQMYTRAWWSAHRFQSLAKGEDYWFQDVAAKAGQLHSIDGDKYVVARAHPGSLSPPMLGHAQLPAVDRHEFPEQFWKDTHQPVFPA